jgi:hypothetical protein
MKKNSKEVVVELVRNTTKTVRKLVRFDEDVDFANPSEKLQKLLAEEFLNPKREPPSVEETMTILRDVDMEDYRYRDINTSNGIETVPVNDELVYMRQEYWEDSPTPTFAPFDFLSKRNVQSVLFFGKKQTEHGKTYFLRHSHEDFVMMFSEKKEDLVSAWKERKIKKFLDAQVWGSETRYQLRKVFDFFEKGIPTKRMKDGWN